MENVNNYDVGQRIKSIRISQGLTQSQLAEYIASKTNVESISKGTVNNWEHGRNLPNKSRIKAIADLGGVSVDYLLNGEANSFLESVSDYRAQDLKNSEVLLNNIKATFTPDVMNSLYDAQIPAVQSFLDLFDMLVNPSKDSKIDYGAIIFVFSKLLTLFNCLQVFISDVGDGKELTEDQQKEINNITKELFNSIKDLGAERSNHLNN